MAKGSLSKELVTKKILETFSGSFVYDKEIRIPLQEDGEEIQLKCVLTCAKVNVEPNGDIAIPGEEKVAVVDSAPVSTVSAISQEEKDNLKQLMQTFGL